jgi:hypothetical protein
MKFSTEAMVAVAVAVVFVLLSFGAIAREQGQEPARGGRNSYIATNNVNLSRSLQAARTFPALTKREAIPAKLAL